MLETHAKRTVREERTQDTYNPYLGDATESAQKRKGNISATKV